MADLDNGYHNYGSDWWTNEECGAAYSYASLNYWYTEDYFNSDAHPDESKASDLYNYMQEVYRNNFGFEFESFFEIGGGSAELSKQLDKRKMRGRTLEGTRAGYNKLIKQGVEPHFGIIFKDLRKYNPVFGYEKYDITICTEVAEHIEPWFSSKVVEICTGHSDVVWFSAADSDRPSHYHHPNEAPIWAWDNIFEFFGYRYIELDGRYDRADRLYIKND